MKCVFLTACLLLVSLALSLSGSQAMLLFALSSLIVFLILAALHESWSIPLAVILVVPLGLFGALLAFGAGVLPLALAHGASAGAQKAVGTGVFGGIVTATVLAIFLVPLFFCFTVRKQKKAAKFILSNHRSTHFGGNLNLRHQFGRYPGENGSRFIDAAAGRLNYVELRAAVDTLKGNKPVVAGRHGKIGKRTGIRITLHELHISLSLSQASKRAADFPNFPLRYHTSLIRELAVKHPLTIHAQVLKQAGFPPIRKNGSPPPP